MLIEFDAVAKNNRFSTVLFYLFLFVLSCRFFSHFSSLRQNDAFCFFASSCADSVVVVISRARICYKIDAIKQKTPFSCFFPLTWKTNNEILLHIRCTMKSIVSIRKSCQIESINSLKMIPIWESSCRQRTQQSRFTKKNVTEKKANEKSEENNFALLAVWNESKCDSLNILNFPRVASSSFVVALHSNSTFHFALHFVFCLIGIRLRVILIYYLLLCRSLLSLLISVGTVPFLRL